MMKSIITAVGVVIIMSVLVNNREVLFDAFHNTAMYQKAETIEVEVHPDWASDEEAVSAAKGVIQRKAWEADKERLEGQIEALQAQYETDLDALKLDLDDVDKNLGIY